MRGGIWADCKHVCRHPGQDRQACACWSLVRFEGCWVLTRQKGTHICPEGPFITIILQCMPLLLVPVICTADGLQHRCSIMRGKAREHLVSHIVRAMPCSLMWLHAGRKQLARLPARSQSLLGTQRPALRADSVPACQCRHVPRSCNLPALSKHSPTLHQQSHVFPSFTCWSILSSHCTGTTAGRGLSEPPGGRREIQPGYRQ